MRQDYWPGLGLERGGGGGVEVPYTRLQTIGGRLITEFDHVYKLLRTPVLPSEKVTAGTMDWYPAWATFVTILTFGEHLSCLVGDVMAECAAAGALVATSGRNYQFVDQGAWRASPPHWDVLEDPIKREDEGRYRVSNAYPGHMSWPEGNTIQLAGAFGLGFNPIEDVERTATYQYESRERLREMLMSCKPEALSGHANGTTDIANGLTEAAHALMYRAQEIRDAPWVGADADKAQEALRSIYENIRGLAAVHGQVARGTEECAQVLRTAQSRFDHVVNKGGWEISDIWNGDDKDARAFMAEVQRQLGDALRRMPQEANIRLPGLIPEHDRDVYSMDLYSRTSYQNGYVPK
ncbi:hypothetical protein OG339_30050 [Streptosporangium sp. NBC_01495]|nr:hypothetical protein [Streptosporangium sp. NBC_01495]